jgi:hypothetical protein
MVFCRGCAREIHETAPHCPQCGAPQFVPAMVDAKRNVGKLIGWAFVWTLAFWFGMLILAGMVAGMLDPQDAHAAGQRAGEALSGVSFLIAIFLSAGLTVAGVLPGTKKNQ